MPVEIDLHIHTRASEDGEFTPRQIMEQARALNLRAIAFADHDSVDSVAEGVALAGEFGIAFAPCVELSTRTGDHDLHVLAYFIDPADESLRELMQRNFDMRLDLAARRVVLLRELGFEIAFEDVVAAAGGRSPTTRAFIEALKRHPSNVAREDFSRYLAGDRAGSPVYNFYRDWFTVGRSAYCELHVIDTMGAIALVRRIGGVPVLAHPGRTPMELLDGLLDAGLAGLEVWCSTHTIDDERRFAEYARRHGLAMTAGSDFHGPSIKPDVKLAGTRRGAFELFQKLRQRVT